ncbi:DUF2760 domain-containing protein [Xenophilus arseniciresistens]|uniref:DUF2760 domain-containing protein n=1 Tax=Xenophilus arseniciresistens TaxID=1283306 RepID=A0AAE3NAJ9_9BURK|nr:DUF2760 domain-containing protein [Xenophilus arseniciresistens]MDA7417624.1 DUF2760 domain-containing protein [Xenophilus arseniciresistens]
MTDAQPLSFFARLGLAFSVLGDGRLAARLQALRNGAAPVEAVAPAATPAPVTPPAPAPAAVRATANVDAALQLLAALQREARFVDFLQEDIAAYSDAEVGGAARMLHGGARKVLQESFDLEPVRTESEGSRLTLPAGFDASAVRLTGNVVGQAPFTGTLQHKGWRATAVRLPALTEGHDARVIAAAEVEL